MSAKAHISRVTRTKAEAKATYNRLSRWYDLLASPAEKRIIELGLIKLKVSEGETVLEIGFGTGHALLALATTVGDSGRVCGIDISRGMANVARKRMSRANLSQRVFLEQGDAVALPFMADIFDAVFMSFTLELFDTKEIVTVLAESRRVIKPGGRLCVVAMARDKDENLPQRIYEWFHQRLPAYVDCRPIYVQSTLAQTRLQIQDVTRKFMWGLPMEVCLAIKPVNEEKR